MKRIRRLVRAVCRYAGVTRAGSAEQGERAAVLHARRGAARALDDDPLHGFTDALHDQPVWRCR
ncbi:hypothetical protein [Streptomyces sp. NPDC050504]|uniref:hypothetical protein n=1 Tax=Streptomyces sp. NPDC050504 TaxID=3365618 RepID=UPI0037B085C5